MGATLIAISRSRSRISTWARIRSGRQTSSASRKATYSPADVLTPALRDGAPLSVDLIPDVPAEKATQALDIKPAKLRLAHWLKNTLRLPPAKVALFFEMVSGHPPARADWVQTVKALPVRHAGLRPMDEAISTAGGVAFNSLTPDLMLTARPGVFCAGEMLDWEAPTGGYLITASLATGRWAGLGAARYLADAA